MTFTSDAFAQTRAIQNGTLTFYCINDNGTTSAAAVAIAFSVRASAVTGFTSAGEVGSRYIAPEDVATRVVSLGLAFIPILDGYPQNVSYLRSLDNGVNYTPIGWTMMKTAGQQIVIPTLAPGVASNFRIAAITGALQLPAVPIPAASLPAGAYVSGSIAIAGLAVPIATLVSSLTVAASTGVAPATSQNPYNCKRKDGSQYWSIPTVTVDDTGAVGAPDAFYLRITVQDLDASRNPVGPEHPFDGAQIGQLPAVHVFGPLMGEYGTDAQGTLRTGNIAYVRLKEYLCNRVDQTEYSFANALCAKLQSGVGGGVGYVDVLVATGGTAPTGAIDPAQLDPSGWPHAGDIIPGTPTYRAVANNQIEIQWPFTAPVDPNFAGVELAVEAPDQGVSPQAKSDGTTPWDGTMALTGAITPLSFRQPYNAANPQPLLATIPAPSYAMSVRLIALSFSINLTNTTGPQAVISIPASTAAKPAAGTAYAPCVGGITAVVGADKNLNGVLTTPITFTVTGLPTADPTWSSYVVIAQFPDGGFVPMTGPLSNSGQEIDPVTPATVINVVLWAVSQSLDSTNTLQTNPIVPGITPSCTVSYGTTGYTIPPVQTTTPPTGMAIAVTVIDGPTTPAGIQTYGWTGTLTPPSDKTFYSGCDLSRQLPPDGECLYNSLGPADTTFSNGYYPRPAVDTPGCVFRAYPKNKDGVRGTPVSVTATVTKAGSQTLNLGETKPGTTGLGIALDPVTGYPVAANTNPGTSLVWDWDFAISRLGQIQTNITSSWGWGGTSAVIRTDGDANGNYCRLTNANSNIQQTFAMTAGQALSFACRVRSSNTGGTHFLTWYVFWLDGAGVQIGATQTVGTVNGYVSGWTAGPSAILQAPANAAHCLFQLIVSPTETAGGYWDVGKILVQPVVNQTVGTQTQSMVPAAGVGNNTIIQGINYPNSSNLTPNALQIIGPNNGAIAAFINNLGVLQVSNGTPLGNVGISIDGSGVVTIQIQNAGVNHVGYTGAIAGRSSISGLVV